MNKFSTRLATGMATATLMMSLLAPAVYADTTLEISGNGKNSNNDINVSSTNSDTIKQNNTSNINIDLNVTAKTGGNKANDNAGDVNVKSGNATTNIDILIGGNSNEATVDDCGCTPENLNVTISGNHKNSNNTVNKTASNSKTKKQKNNTTFNLTGNVKAKTGKNKANGNLGNGTVNVTSGNANTTVNVTVDPSSNTLNP